MAASLNIQRGCDVMGMTDRQFDSYQAQLVRNLKKALKDIEEKGDTTELKELIAEIETELKRP